MSVITDSYSERSIAAILCIPSASITHQTIIPIETPLDRVISVLFDRFKLQGLPSQYKLFILRDKVNCLELVNFSSTNTIVFYENNFRHILELLPSPVMLYLSRNINVIGEKRVLDDSSLRRRLFVNGDEYYLGTMFAWIEYAITLPNHRDRQELFAHLIACIDAGESYIGFNDSSIASARLRSLLTLASGSKLWINVLDFEVDIINNVDGLRESLIDLGRKLTADTMIEWSERIFFGVSLSMLVSISDSRYRYTIVQ